MLRSLVVLAVLAHATPVHADGKTWCVGGLAFSGASTRVDTHACESEQKNRNLTSWHWHNDWFVEVIGETGCYTCWDMTDDTCNSKGVQQGIIKVISAKECADIGPARLGKKTFYDPENKWRPNDDPIRVIPLDEPVVRPKVTRPPEVSKRPEIVDAAVEEVAVVLDPPPGAPKRTPIAIQIGVRVSPGPYAVNDPITMTGFATGGGGTRAVTGGYFSWVDPNGQPIGGPRIAATPGPRGTVVATGAAPRAGAVMLVYQPGGIEVKASEQLAGKPAPGQAAIQVSQCRLRGVVIAPGNGDLVAVTAAIKLPLRGRFESSTGGATTLGGATAIFAVEIDGKEQRIPARDVGGEWTGKLALDPPAGDSEEIAVRLFGDGGGNDACPGPTAKVTVTKLGVGLEVVAKAASCYVGRPCALEAKFRLPGDPISRTAAVTFATAPDLEVAVTENGTRSAALAAVTAGNPETLFTGSFKPITAGVIEIETIARSRAQNREIKNTIRLTIREPIELVLPAKLDLGTVIAGTGWPAGCAALDFTKSRGVLEQHFTMRSTLPKDCSSRPALSSGGLGVPLPDGLDVEMQYDSRVLAICVADVPRCADEHPAPVILTITPVNPDFADQRREVELTWRVEGRSFFACHWWWIVIGAGGLVVLLVGYGFVRPYDFTAHDSIKMANDRQKLQRAVGRRLRELPGGRAGWYRNATTGLRDDGSATRALRQAAIVLEARKGDVILRSRGGLQRVNPQSKKLEPVDTGRDGVLASKGASYVVGNLHFSIN